MSEVRVNPDSTVVITSENSAAYYAKKLDIAPATATVEVTDEGKTTPAEGEQSATVQAEKTEKKDKPNPFAERIGEVTAKRREAEALAAEERTKREAAERERDELRAKLNPPKEEEKPVVVEGKPKPEDFKDAFEYAEALSTWSTEQALAARDKKDAEAKAKDTHEKAVKSWNERKAKAVEKLPDYEEVLNKADHLMVSDVVRDAIRESDLGHELLYYLATNPAEVERLKPMSALRALRELGKMESKLEAPKAEVKEEKQEVKISQAAAPITPLKGNNAPPEVPINSKGEFTGTYKQWKEGRNTGKIH